MNYDYTVSLNTDDFIEDIGEPEIKRVLTNAMVWLSGFCTNHRIMEQNNLYDTTINIIHYFDRLLRSEGEDIHNFAEATLIRCDDYSTVVRFRGVIND